MDEDLSTCFRVSEEAPTKRPASQTDRYRLAASAAVPTSSQRLPDGRQMARCRIDRVATARYPAVSGRHSVGRRRCRDPAGDVLARIPRKVPRPRTSPVVCHAWRNCSKRVDPRTRDHRRNRWYVRLAATTRTSVASISNRSRRCEPWNTWFRKASTFRFRKATSIQKGDYSGRQPRAA